jgi:hypothetical protein
MDDISQFVEKATRLLDDEAELTIQFGKRADFPSDPYDAADAFVSKLGYATLGKGWFDLNEDSAEPTSHLANILKRDLVGHNFDWLSPSEAENCSTDFYSLFREGEVTRLANHIRNGWNPITSSTIEAAFVAMDAVRIGLFLVEAED